MNFMSRMLRSFLVLTALLLTCISLSADWLVERGGLTDCFDNCVSLLEALRKGEQMSREAQITVERLGIKGKVVEALKNGELTLVEAAAIFCSLHEDPKSWHHPRRPWPGLKDSEGWCRVVIEWTASPLFSEQSPGQSDALRRRLEAELQEHLKRHGTVTLPK